MKSIPDDVTIISGDNEEIQSNKYILSIFCPTLGQLLSASSTLLLPECSTFSIKYLLNMLNDGFAVTEKLSNEDINEIIATAQVLLIEMTGLYLIDPELPEPQTNKRKRNYIPRNNISVISYHKYQCQECDYMASKSWNLRTHVEAKHEGVRYPCDQCEYKATTAGSLKTHSDSIHAGVCFPCGQCKYKATQAGNLQRHVDKVHKGQCNSRANFKGHLREHVESIHDGVRYPCDQCDYKATDKGNLKKHEISKHC